MHIYTLPLHMPAPLSLLIFFGSFDDYEEDRYGEYEYGEYEHQEPNSLKRQIGAQFLGLLGLGSWVMIFFSSFFLHASLLLGHKIISCYLRFIK